MAGAFGDRQVRYMRTSESGGAGPCATEAISGGATLLIAAGGDGTMMETINAAVGSGVPVGIVPLGTANLLALNLDIPSSVEEAVKIAVGGVPTEIDLVKVNATGHYFAIMGGIGFDARIMHETARAEKRRFGRLAYLRTALKHIRGHRFAVTVTLDDRPPIRLLAKSVLIANLGELMPGLSLFADTSPSDGIIEVGLLKASRLQHFLSLIGRLILRRADQDPSFDVYQARRVRVETSRPQPFELDGDPQDHVSHIDMEVAPKAATIMLPRP